MTNRTASPLALLNDNPDPDRDLLDFSRYAAPLADVIANPQTQTPLTIGIYGRWGTGKTTLMHLIRRRLDAEAYVHVEFVPWLYGGEENLLVPLLHSLQDALQQSPVARLQTAAARVAQVTARIAAALTLKTISAGQVSLGDVDDEIQRFGRVHSQPPSSLGQLRDELRRVAEQITDGGRTRLVIYVDDLDRCLPGKIIELLEAVKLFLGLPHTVFLLAVDFEIVEYGIRAHYQDFQFSPEKLASLTADYLDKMVQIPIFLHPLEQSEMRAYLRELLAQAQRELPEDVLAVLAASLLPNPRQIKRVLNLLALHSQVAATRPPEAAPLDPGLFARLVLVQQQWPELYARLRVYPRLLETLGQVLRGHRQLNIAADWSTLEAASPGLRDFCRKTVETMSPQLRALFTPGPAQPAAVFENAGLQPYLQMLG